MFFSGYSYRHLTSKRTTTGYYLDSVVFSTLRIFRYVFRASVLWVTLVYGSHVLLGRPQRMH